jgi:hypothetical protein
LKKVLTCHNIISQAWPFEFNKIPLMIYSKTELGLNAIKDRSSGLTPRQRSVLIMCDGKRDSGEILKNTAGLGVTAQDLETLVVQKMIAGTSPAPAQVNPEAANSFNSTSSPVTIDTQQAPPAAPRAVSPEELKILVRKATKQLEGLLGPSCESMSLKLEKSKTYDEYAIKIHDIRRVLVSIRSEKVADEFLASALV